MQEKKELKIKFKTAIISIILLLIVVASMFIVIINWDKQNEIEENNTIIGSESPVPTVESNFVTEFLKLENNKENMVYSPLSIKYALKMLSDGANGNTKTQIENVIGDLNLTKYNNIDNILSFANGAYIRDAYAEDIKKDYIKELKEKYDAEINYDSFSNANNINKWIENKTLGIIKNMISDDLVQNPNTVMILINALAIDMEWEEQFDGSKTKGEEFNLENGNKMTAAMMSKETTSDSVSYYKDEDITTLTMDLKKYDDTQLEFVAIMPNGNLSDYVETFSIDEYNNILNKTTFASDTENGVEITIPRFSFDYNLSLKQDLIKLGITDAFDETNADFSTMASKELYVSDALHKAKIDFTEKGVKAAAATAIAMETKAIIKNPTEPEKIKIDKPFLYLIRDKDTDEIWFVGTVYEPTSWEEYQANY